MATAEQPVETQEAQLDKGLKSGALGLISTTVIATASVAPAYSIAATLVFVVGAVGAPGAGRGRARLRADAADLDRLQRAEQGRPGLRHHVHLGDPRVRAEDRLVGGWAIVVADVLVMASLAQVASQYVFLLFNAKGIGSNATSGWVLLGGVIWIILMTAICYVGIEVSANFQKILLGIELTMLFVLSIVALVKVGAGTAPPGHLTPSIQWLNPFHISSFSAFASGIILMVFIYWGWDTAVAVNEETKDKTRTPGLAAIFSTFILLVTYALVIFSMQAFAGRQDHGQRPGQHRQRGRRAVGPGQCHLRHDRLRPGLLPPAAAHGAVLGRRLHPDDDPAHRADHAVDGGLQGAAQVVRHGPPAVHDPHGVHGRHGRRSRSWCTWG